MIRCRTAVLVLAAAAALSTCGCASILSRSTYDVALDTNPTGHEVRVTDRDGRIVHTGTTPVRLPLDSSAGFFRTESYTIEVLDGERVLAERTLDAGLDGWYFGNVLFGWFLGFVIVDPITGAMWSFEDDVLIRVEDTDLGRIDAD